MSKIVIELDDGVLEQTQCLGPVEVTQNGTLCMYDENWSWVSNNTHPNKQLVRALPPGSWKGYWLE